MKQRFFTKTLQGDFIKSLLLSTSIPILDTVQTGDYLVKDNYYIFNYRIIKCTKQGYLRIPYQMLANYSSAVLGNFILGSDRLGVSNSIPKVTVASEITGDNYYLYGEYNLVYQSQTYPDYSSITTYNPGDIVQHYDPEYNQTFLYSANRKVSNELWNPSAWTWICSSKPPYYLILGQKGGYIDSFNRQAKYQIVQNFEPEEINIVAQQYLSPNTYYLAINQTGASLIYNTDAGYYGTPIAEYQTVNSYIPGNYYPQFTEQYVSSSNYYDSDTHKQLGKYLRWYRDIYFIDLMEYYNCWNAEYLIGYIINDGHLIKKSSDSYRMIKVPIKFDKVYTIAIDCLSDVTMMPAIINNGKPIEVQLGSGSKINLTNLLNPNSTVTFNQLMFNVPITYSVNNNSDTLVSILDETISNQTLTYSQLLQRYKDDLYLLIQIPYNNNSSIVVLEGDYTQNKSTIVFNLDQLPKLSRSEFNQCLTSKLSLLQINDGVSYPFSDRLIEFLLENVITSHDEIGEDITRVHQDIHNYQEWDSDVTSWTDYLRKTLYDLYCTSLNTQKIDISGYVDKDVEQYISTLQE